LTNIFVLFGEINNNNIFIITEVFAPVIAS